MPKTRISVQALPQSALDRERRPGVFGTMKQPTLQRSSCFAIRRSSAARLTDARCLAATGAAALARLHFHRLRSGCRQPTTPSVHGALRDLGAERRAS